MKKKFETILAHDPKHNRDVHGAVVPPIYQNSLFTFEGWDDIDGAFDDRQNRFIYSRGKNPTVKLAEQKLAELAGAEKAQLFPSGMAAITASCLHFLEPGDHVITIKNVYGPANNLLSQYLPKKMNTSLTYVSGMEVREFEAQIRPNTKLIYLESPSSVVFSLQDFPAITALAKQHGIKTIADNTWATPIFQNTLEMGVDLEIHSTSKYLGGHSDLVGGVVLGRQQDIDAISSNEYELLGAKTAPMEAWLLIRSLRSLTVRLQRHQENAMKVATFLEQHSKVEQIHYPGLKSFPQYALGQKLLKGYTGLMSFRLATNDVNKVKAFVNTLKLFQLGVSWGGHESLVYVPAISYLKELSATQFDNLGISLGDVRISVGLEHVDDLIQDLNTALAYV